MENLNSQKRASANFIYDVRNNGFSLREFLAEDVRFTDPQYAMLEGVVHSVDHIDVTLTSTIIKSIWFDNQSWHTPRYYFNMFECGIRTKMMTRDESEAEKCDFMKKRAHYRYKLHALEKEALESGRTIVPLHLYNIYPDTEFFDMLYFFGFHNDVNSGTELKMSSNTTKGRGSS